MQYKLQFLKVQIPRYSEGRFSVAYILSERSTAVSQ
jgi:hypothetical protein